MTANLVTGYSQTSDYMPQANALPNQNSSAGFSEIFKSSTENIEGKTIASKAKEDTKGEGDNLVANKKSSGTNGDKIDDKSVDSANSKEDASVAKSGKENTVTDAVNKQTEDVINADEVTDISDENANDIPDEILEVVAEAISEMVQSIAEVLNVSEKQVTEAVGKLGLNESDLLNAKVIPELTVELTDASDTMDIMTDEAMFADVNSLMKTADEVVQNLATEMDIPVDEVIDQIKEAKANMETETVLQSDEMVDSMPISSLNGEKAVGEMGATIQVEKTAIEDSKNQAEMPVKNDDILQSTNEYHEVVNVASKKENENGKETSNKDQNANAEHAGAFGNTVLDSLKDAVAKIDNNNLVSYADTRSRIEDIMNQVSENLKLTMKNDVTEMEMQLHPASLGNVKVQVAVRDGAITASFTTQNEQVRQALESQVVELKEQLNNQGIKVEAVEVTVSSHGFERNLNEEGDKQERKSEEEAKARKTRGINLRGLSLEDIEELDEEDKVTADMMARNGNTLDYLA